MPNKNETLNIFKCLFYNFVTSLILGIFPTIIYAFKADQKKFIETINNLINNEFAIYYFSIVAFIGLIFKAHVWFSTFECKQCDKIYNLNSLSNKLFEPFFSVIFGASGCMIGLWIVAFFTKNVNLTIVLLGIMGAIIIFGISLFDYQFNKKMR